MALALLGDDEIDQRLDGMEGWRREGTAIVREFRFDDFVGSVGFVNRVLEPAEQMNHHPDLAISWNSVTVSVSTHSQGGLTAADFELASKIDAVA
jgi:4a-hydroxytetrahydrobiopterin dehydratase